MPPRSLPTDGSINDCMTANRFDGKIILVAGAYLLSSEASYIVGAELYIDGGLIQL